MSRSNSNLEVFVLVEGRNAEKNRRREATSNNKLKPHETACTGIEPRSQR